MLLPLSALCKEKIRPFVQIRTEMKNFVMHPSCNFRPVPKLELISALPVYDPQTFLKRLANRFSLL